MRVSAGDVAAEGTLGVVGKYEETGGELKGSGLLTVNVSADWTGGSMTGMGTTRVTGALAISGGNGTVLSRLLENGGSGTWTGGDIGGSNGTIANLSTGSFSGQGSFTGNLTNQGQLFPGAAGTAGTISLGGNFQHTAGTVHFDLGAPGSGSDLIAVTSSMGMVNLGGALSVNTLTGFDPDAPYTLIAVGGSNPVMGYFTNKPEGAIVDVAGYQYRITYHGGDGNDVVLFMNHPPVLASIGNRSVNEAATLNFTAAATDPENDTLTWSLVNPPTGFGVSAFINSSTGAFSFSCNDGPANYNVTIQVSDVFGNTDSETFTITVNNVAPTATMNVMPPMPPMPGMPGSGQYQVWFTNQQDPSSADTTAGFTYRYDLNEDGDFDDAGESSSSSMVTFNFTTNGTHTIRARIYDKDGGYTEYWQQVLIDWL